MNRRVRSHRRFLVVPINSHEQLCSKSLLSKQQAGSVPGSVIKD